MAWVVACASALALQVGMTAYWSWHWQELHASLRLSLASIAGLVLAGRCGLARRQRLLDHAVAAACFIAFAMTLVLGAERRLPSSAIAWAACIGFLVCLLAPAALYAEQRLDRTVFALGSMAGLVAVALSQSRGAYGLLPWLIGMMVWTVWRTASAQARAARLAASAGVCAALVVAVALLTPDSVKDRLALGWSELHTAVAAPASSASADTSIGARVELWQLALNGFASSPWLGVGPEERLRLIQSAGEQLGSRELSSLGHVHNEFLQAALDNGVIGLAAAALLAAGPWALAWGMRRRDRRVALQLAGIAFMHSTAALTNVNTAHNYYGAMLGACILVALLGASERAGPSPQVPR